MMMAWQLPKHSIECRTGFGREVESYRKPLRRLASEALC